MAKLDHHHRHTVAAIFAHPIGHNIQWRDVVTLFERLGEVLECHRGGWRVMVAGQSYTIGRARSRELSEDEVVRVRHVLVELGVDPQRVAA